MTKLSFLKETFRGYKLRSGLLAVGIMLCLAGSARDFTFTYKGQTLNYTVLDEEAKTCATKEGTVEKIFVGPPYDRMSSEGISTEQNKGQLRMGPIEDNYYRTEYHPGSEVAGSIEIPEYASDGKTEYKVVRVSPLSFCECDVTQALLPPSITHIGEYAFYFTNLKNMDVPDQVTEIGEGAFKDCYKMTETHLPSRLTRISPLLFDLCLSLKSLAIPVGVEAIDSCAFGSCSNLEKVDLPEGLIKIGSRAFACCEKLNIEEIPESVIEIGDEAFQTCYAQEDIALPANLRILGRGVFYYCPRLQRMSIPEGITELTSTFQGCENLVSVILPQSLTSINYKTFNGCYQLASVNFPENLEIIGDEAFHDCRALTSAILPNKVRSVGIWAFSGCTGLTEVEIPSSLGSIEDGAFSGCTAIKEVEIPSSVVSIGSGAFYNADALTSVRVNSVVPPKIHNDTFDKGTYQRATLTVPPGSLENYEKVYFWDQFIHKTTEVNNITKDAREVVARLTPDGTPAAEAYTGVVIIHYSDGSTSKELIRR